MQIEERRRGAICLVMQQMLAMERASLTKHDTVLLDK